MTKHQKMERDIGEIVVGIAVLITIILFAVIGVLLAFAPEIVSGTQTAQSRFGGMWVSGGETVEIVDRVEEDAFIAGNRVTLSEDADQDVFAAGNTVTINGDVAGSVRAAGATVIIDSTIEQNVQLAGSTVWIKKDGHVKGDASIFAGEVIVDGQIDGQTGLAAGTAMLDGIFRDSVDVSAETVQVRGNARFSAPVFVESFRSDIDAAAIGTEQIQLSEESFVERQVDNGGSIGRWVIWQLLSALAKICVGILIIVLAPRWFRHVTHLMHTRVRETWRDGALFFLAVPSAILLLMLSLIGIPLALFTASLYGATLFSGQLFTGMLLGSLVLRSGEELSKKDHKVRRGLVIGQFALGMALLSVVMLVPFFGSLISLLAMIWGAGGIVTNYRMWRAKD